VARYMWNRSFPFVPRYQFRGAGKWQISKSASLFVRKIQKEIAVGSRPRARMIPLAPSIFATTRGRHPNTLRLAASMMKPKLRRSVS